MFDTLGFLWPLRDSTPYLLYLLGKLVDGLSEERMRPPPPLQSITTLYEVTIGINQSFNMEPANSADVCDGNFKSKNITVHGNQTVPRVVYGAEQREALEMITIVEEKYPIAQRDCVNTYC